MSEIERRTLMKGAALSALAFSVGGKQVLLSPREARAENIPFRTLTPEQGEILEALGETLVPGAQAAGISQFVDQQLSIPPEEALLEARILNIRPPYANFYRAALVRADPGETAIVVVGEAGAINCAERGTIEIRIRGPDIENARFHQCFLRRN